MPINPAKNIVHKSFVQDLHDDIPSYLGMLALVLIDAFYTVSFKNIGLLLQSGSFPTEIMLPVYLVL